MNKQQSNLEVKPSMHQYDYEYLLEHFPNDVERVKNCFDIEDKMQPL